MVELVLLRHGPTAWNEARRIQGRRDEALSEAGRQDVRRWRVPAAFAHYAWVTSPLSRCRETAALLGHAGAPSEPRLIEMAWGDWEGHSLAALREALGPALAENERRGLDFRPAGGESPREVQARLQPWLAALGEADRPTVAVTHKGVIRALYAAARGWDMIALPPDKLAWDRAHAFAVEAGGAATIARLNIPLTEAAP